MAYETNSIALAWSQGKYAVVTQRVGSVDTDRMKREGLFRDVAALGSGYDDRVAVLTPRDLESYAVTSNTKTWVEELPSDVFVVLVHEGEWESGLGD
jgi:hypothetical protein